jgi:hypothetical protein
LSNAIVFSMATRYNQAMAVRPKNNKGAGLPGKLDRALPTRGKTIMTSYIFAGLPILTKTAQQAFSRSAYKVHQALAANGQHYDIRDINDTLGQWLEQSIEALCEDACDLVVTGERSQGFERSYFEDLLQKLPVWRDWEAEAAAVQEQYDQVALAVERIVA